MVNGAGTGTGTGNKAFVASSQTRGHEGHTQGLNSVMLPSPRGSRYPIFEVSAYPY